MSTKALVFAVSCSALVFGCGSDQPSDLASENQEIIDNLVQAGFPASDIQVFDGKVYVGLDAEVSLQASREMLQTDPADDREQYRTTNLVGTGVTNICVNGAAFTGIFSTALTNAIGNYNALGLRWHMTRTSGSTTGCSATITARVSSGTGGSSGFPSGGLPFNTINIGSGLQSGFPTSTVTHVITHELGHCVGFRHSDFFNRSISCGGAATNEGTAGVGAILIPGTPSGATVGGSVMNSCFRQTETGKFTSTDITALNALY
ncbi:MAG TPA: M57 family metalloprotease [Kofleriaceae bacterium]